MLVFNCTGARDGETLLGPLASLQSIVHFDHVVFTPNITFASNTYRGDLLNHGAPADPELKAQKHLESSWVTLVAAGEPEKQATSSQTVVLPSIEHSVNWIDEYTKAEVEKGTDQVQVLVTGSLHLVGGVQSVLECDVI